MKVKVYLPGDVNHGQCRRCEKIRKRKVLRAEQDDGGEFQRRQVLNDMRILTVEKVQSGQQG